MTGTFRCGISIGLKLILHPYVKYQKAVTMLHLALNQRMIRTLIQVYDLFHCVRYTEFSSQWKLDLKKYFGKAKHHQYLKMIHVDLIYF